MMFPNENDIRKVSAILKSNLSFDSFKPISSSGLTHEHIVIDGSDYILRVPRKNQLNMEPLEYLKQQKFVYDIASTSGVTPTCKGIIEPSEDLPNGALIISRIDGRRITSSADLPAVAECLAKMSRVKPIKSDLIVSAEKPFATIDDLNNFFLNTYLDRIDADVAEHVSQLSDKIKFNLDFVRASAKKLPIGMIGGDSHLGNYMIDKQGKAWFVDLEFTAFDVPTLDTADAILDITKQLVPENSDIEVTNSDRDNFYRVYFDNVENADELKPLVRLSEDLVTLRTISWACYWRAEGKFDVNRPPKHICDNYDMVCNEVLNVNNLKLMLDKCKAEDKIYPQFNI